MKVLGIIPARYASSRYPGKPLLDILGKSMIQRVYEQACKSTLINDVVIATDDQRIYDHVLEFNGNVLMTSEHHQNGTERCGEVISNYPDSDVVINIQGDEPLVKPEQLELVIQLFEDPTVEIGTLVKPIEDSSEIDNPNRIKVVLDKDGNALYFSRSNIPYTREQEAKLKHIGIYAWRMNTLKELIKLEATELEKKESLEQLRWLYHGYKIRTAHTTIETPNIDTPEDVEAVLRALNR